MAFPRQCGAIGLCRLISATSSLVSRTYTTERLKILIQWSSCCEDGPPRDFLSHRRLSPYGLDSILYRMERWGKGGFDVSEYS